MVAFWQCKEEIQPVGMARSEFQQNSTLLEQQDLASFLILVLGIAESFQLIFSVAKGKKRYLFESTTARTVLGRTIPYA